MKLYFISGLMFFLILSCRSATASKDLSIVKADDIKNNADSRTTNGKAVSTVSVNRAQYDQFQDRLIISVSYAGSEDSIHKFKLKLEGCKKVFPPECDATLIDTTKDADKTVITHDLLFTRSEAGIDQPEYSEALLRIKGKDNTESTVTLPKIN